MGEPHQIVVKQTIEFQVGDSDADSVNVAKLIAFAKKLGITQYARDSYTVEYDGQGREIQEDRRG